MVVCAAVLRQAHEHDVLPTDVLPTAEIQTARRHGIAHQRLYLAASALPSAFLTFSVSKCDDLVPPNVGMVRPSHGVLQS